VPVVVGDRVKKKKRKRKEIIINTRTTALRRRIIYKNDLPFFFLLRLLYRYFLSICLTGTGIILYAAYTCSVHGGRATTYCEIGAINLKKTFAVFCRPFCSPERVRRVVVVRPKRGVGNRIPTAADGVLSSSTFFN